MFCGGIVRRCLFSWRERNTRAPTLACTFVFSLDVFISPVYFRLSLFFSRSSSFLSRSSVNQIKFIKSIHRLSLSIYFLLSFTHLVLRSCYSSVSYIHILLVYVVTPKLIPLCVKPCCVKIDGVK
ncbi:hypothetical protein L873DRAFT_69991 [Choiromyces venosus 120613-1]|uniref:Uncharacterized protein n=1 Tax=Choiromyces venosus 120613-1 TaxID=1336337 RepID=A0A3N4J560_9PEZI|nr:hypothetical protein L873DRAFT_69991 [Choiromyces venosus 120613-1]